MGTARASPITKLDRFLYGIALRRINASVNVVAGIENLFGKGSEFIPDLYLKPMEIIVCVKVINIAVIRWGNRVLICIDEELLFSEVVAHAYPKSLTFTVLSINLSGPVLDRLRHIRQISPIYDQISIRINRFNSFESHVYLVSLSC